jgi:serine/threonine-protein kinase
MAGVSTDVGGVTPDEARWRRVRDIFDLAADAPVNQWDDIIDREAAGDAAMQAEVRRLLDALRADALHLDEPTLLMGGDDGDVDDRVGTVVSRYRLVRLIGHGGMGSVYEGTRVAGDFDQRVAVKFIRMLGRGGELAARFRRERQILATLEHRNIARLLDGGTTEHGDPYFIMEYVEGVPITEYCDASTLTITGRLHLFLQVFAAVEHAHGKLIVHRDLKPANMLVAADGSVKLLDFGVAKLLGAQDGDQLTTVAQSRPFTPEYASPEQLRDEPISVASDVYALGVVLYEMLAGRRPYQVTSRSPVAMLRAVEGDVPRPSAVATGDAARRSREGTLQRLRGRLSGELDNVLRKALRTDLNLRYRSVEQFAADVRCYLEGKPVSAQPDRWSYRLRKFVGRHRAGIGVAGVAAAALTGAAFVLLAQAHRAATERNWAYAVMAASSLDELAVARIVGGDVVGADTLLRRADALCGSRPDVRDVNVGCVRVMHDFAVTALWHGDVRQADSLLSHVYTLTQRASPPNPVVLARVMSDMGQVRDAEGNYHGAEDFYRRAAPIFAQLRADRSSDWMEYLGVYAVCLEHQHRFAEADSLVRLQIAGGGGSGDVLLHLALIHAEENRLDVAGGEIRQLAPLMATARSDTGALIYVMMMTADGWVRSRVGDVDTGLVDLRTAVAVGSRRYRPDDPRLAHSQDALGRVLLAQHHGQEAAQYLQLALNTFREKFGPTHPQTMATAAELAEALKKS